MVLISLFDMLCVVFVYISIVKCYHMCLLYILCCFFFFQAEDGIRDLVRSRGLGDVYKRQAEGGCGGWAELVRDGEGLSYGFAIFCRLRYVDHLSLIHI